MGKVGLPDTKYHLGKTVWLIREREISKHIVKGIRYYIVEHLNRVAESNYKYELSGISSAFKEEEIFSSEESVINKLYGDIKRRIKDKTGDY